MKKIIIFFILLFINNIYYGICYGKEINILDFEKGYNVDININNKSKNITTGNFIINFNGLTSAFCIDLFQNIKYNYTYDFKINNNINKKTKQIAWILNNNKWYDKVGKTAIQLSIWEIIYDEEYNLFNGNFNIKYAPFNSLLLSNKILNEIPNNIYYNNIITLKHNKVQDLIVLNPVPESNTIILVCFGFILLFFNKKYIGVKHEN